MNPAIQLMLARYKTQSPEEVNRAIREILQEICLLGIWRAKLFEHLAFYGGTALRILYSLDRFSEDLDFTLLKPNSHFRWEPFAKTIEDELSTYGFDVNLQRKKKSSSSSIQSAFLKTNTLEALLKVGIPTNLIKGSHPNTMLRIKIEVDTDPVPGFRIKQHYLRDPLPIPITAVVEPDLFASKLHAALFRAWKRRVKGRDWYDVVWFIRRGTPLGLAHFMQCLEKNKTCDSPSLITENSLKQMIKNRIDTIDLNSVLEDIRPFIRNTEILQVWTRNFLHSWVDKLTIEKCSDLS